MPEGHTIHRLARLHRRDLGGRRVAVSSPQGRFSVESAQLDGKVLADTEAYGKHLFYHWDEAPSLYVHLGLIGKFRTHRVPAPDPTPQTRLAMHTDEVSVYLTGPMTCRLIDPGEVDVITGPLGPDPLRDPDRVEEFVERLALRRAPVAAALLDQRVVAGIGNVYRSEVLFLCGIEPRRPSDEVGRDEAIRLWDTAVEYLAVGERMGRIVTVRPGEVGERSRAAIPPDLRLFTYHRSGEQCRRCQTPISETVLGGRRAWWCPVCQPR
jgi:endonuclease-8